MAPFDCYRAATDYDARKAIPYPRTADPPAACDAIIDNTFNDRCPMRSREARVGKGKDFNPFMNMASFEDFCDSISRMQHGLFWEIARQSPDDVDEVRTEVNSMDIPSLRRDVRDVASELMLCPSGPWALRYGMLTWEKAAKVLRLVSILSRPRLILGLHVAHHTTSETSILPFANYASFLLAICDSRLDWEELEVVPAESMAEQT